MAPDRVDASSLALWKDTATSLRVYARQITDLAGTIEGVCAEAIPRQAGATLVSDDRTFARTGSRERKYTKDPDERAALQRLVLDTVIRIPEKNAKGKPHRPVTILGRTYQPGEIVELTPVERILWVYPLDEPRKTPLRLLGIDPDACDFFALGEWTNRDVREVVDDIEDDDDTPAADPGPASP
jgi:hypothetical protein